MGSVFHTIKKTNTLKDASAVHILHATLLTLCFSVQPALAEDTNHHAKPAKQSHSDHIKEPTHRARVVAVYDAPKDSMTDNKKNSPHGAEYLPSPNTVFSAYKHAVVAGELNAYERFYSQALLSKTNKQTENYSAQQITNLKRWNQKLMSCRDDKIISEKVNGDTATIIYELTDTCKKNITSKKSYQRVTFKRELKHDSKHNARARAWKIHRLTFSSKNDFEKHGYLKLNMGIM